MASGIWSIPALTCAGDGVGDLVDTGLDLCRRCCDIVSTALNGNGAALQRLGTLIDTGVGLVAADQPGSQSRRAITQSCGTLIDTLALVALQRGLDAEQAVIKCLHTRRQTGYLRLQLCQASADLCCAAGQGIQPAGQGVHILGDGGCTVCQSLCAAAEGVGAVSGLLGPVGKGLCAAVHLRCAVTQGGAAVGQCLGSVRERGRTV